VIRSDLLLDRELLLFYAHMSIKIAVAGLFVLTQVDRVFNFWINRFAYLICFTQQVGPKFGVEVSWYLRLRKSTALLFVPPLFVKLSFVFLGQITCGRNICLGLAVL
jgi:hypothetical protein